MSACSVSFIVPYYQISACLLKRCLDSLLAVAATTDCEVILVDDGTPDTKVPSWLVDWQMEKKVRYHYQENKGLGGARNTGMKLATKEYIQFVDPDDYLIAEHYAAVWSLLQEKQPDLLAFDFRMVYDVEPKTVVPCRSVLYEGSGVHFMCSHNLRAGACFYLFRRILAVGLLFLEHTYHEDEAFTPLLYLRAQTLIATRIPLYAYYQREDSIMNSPDRGKLHRRFSDFLKIQQSLTALLPTLSHRQQMALRRRVDQNYMSMVYKLLTDSPDRSFLQPYLQEMKQLGVYPLPVRLYTLKYFLFAGLTACPGVLMILRRLLRGRR